MCRYRVSVRAAHIRVCVRIAAAPFQQGSGVLTLEVRSVEGALDGRGRNGSGEEGRGRMRPVDIPCCALLASVETNRREAKASRIKELLYAHASIASSQKSFQTRGRRHVLRDSLPQKLAFWQLSVLV